MTHEFKELINAGIIWKQQGVNVVLATVVSLKGSSYRRPGVRMLLSEKGNWVGAVSGGCVEKEVLFQAKSVFETHESKLMSYDGRFRLGCEGILYILLEPLSLSNEFIYAFEEVLNSRTTFNCESYFKMEGDTLIGLGSQLIINDRSYSLTQCVEVSNKDEFDCFSQSFSPIFQLYIFGAEHDAVQLCKMATQIGWQVHIIAPPDEAKSLEYFKGAISLNTPIYENIDTSKFDNETAVVLMTHSFNKDIQYLMALKDVNPCYMGLLGPSHRRERIFSKLVEYLPDVEPEFFENIYGPMGVDIGAESASEIALSILAEILSVIRNKQPIFLKDKKGHIHE
ncbi:XdhC family protein [Urechidicola vernalis]|uniref:XdhC family protein n=1 Tax=Urechidicola vernalis TaxID=3075600 RepID=A0ABU2Y4A3_9FLAO|nr:XdhC family protein [Urechidicola sp. P050]MDT0552630.1 XdhC family protein [Urechidicola sp. P050]